MEIFDEEWLAAAAAALGSMPEVAGADVTVDYVVAGTPTGKATIGVTVENGQVTAIQIGKSKDPDLVISLKYQAALDILTGGLTSDAGFMNGALKIEGAHERWMLELRPVRLAAVDALADVMAATTA